MIRTHRRRHLRIFVALAVLLPLLLFAALLARPARPHLDGPIDGVASFVEPGSAR